MNYRPAAPGDVPGLSALATQVFLDTYATEGVRPDLAREVRRECSEERFAVRIADPQARVVVAAMGEGLTAFLDLSLAKDSPVAGVSGVEIARLYVLPRFQHQGIGRALLDAACQAARGHGVPAVWLTAWAGNMKALRFYAAAGYRDIGATMHEIEGRSYENRVLVLHVG